MRKRGLLSAREARRGVPTATVLLSGVIVFAFALSGSSAAATPSLYKGSVQRLLPTATQAGYEQITSQSGSGSRASATYQTPGAPPRYMKIAVHAFRTETAAIASFNAACGSGCSLRKVAAGWKYKLRVDLATDRNNTVAIVARCRNLRVDTMMNTRATNPHEIAKPSLLVIDSIVIKARQAGMSPCQGIGTPPPTTGTYYWSESYAEQRVISKVRIPYCNLYPNDSQCRLLPAQGVVDAQCRGLDEKPGTFTYSRFACEILVGYGGKFRGRIAVWPTGPTTLRWQLI
jgi:hypothetical protein